MSRREARPKTARAGGARPGSSPRWPPTPSCRSSRKARRIVPTSATTRPGRRSGRRRGQAGFPRLRAARTRDSSEGSAGAGRRCHAASTRAGRPFRPGRRAGLRPSRSRARWCPESFRCPGRPPVGSPAAGPARYCSDASRSNPASKETSPVTFCQTSDPCTRGGSNGWNSPDTVPTTEISSGAFPMRSRPLLETHARGSDAGEQPRAEKEPSLQAGEAAVVKRVDPDVVEVVDEEPADVDAPGVRFGLGALDRVGPQRRIGEARDRRKDGGPRALQPRRAPACCAERRTGRRREGAPRETCAARGRGSNSRAARSPAG